MTPKKLFFVMIGAVLLTSILTMGGVYLADSYLGDQSAEISLLKAEDELLSTELINSQRTKDQLEEFSYIEPIADEILPDSKNQSEVILLIDEIGDETGINVTTFVFLGTDGQPSEKSQTEPLAGAGGILVFPVEIAFNTTYGQLVNWLDKAEENQRKMQIEEIRIDRIGDESTINSELQVQMKINAYLEK